MKQKENSLDRFLTNPWLICDKVDGCGKKILKNETVLEIELIDSEWTGYSRKAFPINRLKVIHKRCFQKEFGETTKKNY